MARPFMFATLCERAHPLKHSLAESIFVSRVRKTAKKIFVSRSLVSRGITVFFLSYKFKPCSVVAAAVCFIFILGVGGYF